MEVLKIAGVMRASMYSPNHIGNDGAIFTAASDRLRRRGFDVTPYSEEQLYNGEVHEDVILNMCRKPESIEILKRYEEEEGRLVINSGFGVENCGREIMTRILMDNGIPHPQSIIENTNEKVIDALKDAGISSCWIKRSDFHAIHKEDISFCRNVEEAQDRLHEYYYRGIKRAVINRHLPGDLVKFYGVAGQPFFFWFYPYDLNYSKFGDEAINGKPLHTSFSEEALKDTCNRAAQLLNVKIYGGDCIIDVDGSFRIIDFNDWPSFAPCRKEAFPFIARCVLNEIKKWQKCRNVDVK